MAKFAINASGAMLLPSLVQVSESISGSIVPLAMFFCAPFPYGMGYTVDFSIISDNLSPIFQKALKSFSK